MKKSKSRLPWTSVLGAAAVGLLGYACAAPLTPEDARLVPTTMTAVSATTRTATVGSTLTDYPAVTVRDQDGIGLPEVNVTFTASTGTQPSPATKQTNADGQAGLTSWTVPQTSGTVTMTAAVPGFPVTAQTFTVTLNPGPASSAVVNPGTSSNAQSAPAGQVVPVPPSVLVRDQYNNPVSGVNVTFAVTGGAGTVVPTTPVQTNAQGIATATSWTLGTVLGANTLRATVAGVTAPVDFTATGIAGTPTSVIVGGTGTSQGQTAVAGTPVTNAPVVLVRDAGNNPVAGVTVRFTIVGGAGKILANATDNTGANTQDVTTGANGQASIFGWRLGTVGANTLSAALPAHSSVNAFVFTATAIVGPPTQIAVGNIAWATTTTGTAHAGNPSVVVKDAGGNNVSGATVNWTAGTNSSLSGPASSTTNSSGVAIFPRSTVNWTATGAVGSAMTLIATVQGATPALNLQLTSTIVGAPNALVKTAGDNQSAGVNAAVSTKPAVRVVDASNNPVTGVGVTFAVTAGGGSVSGPSVTTDSVGIATVGGWTLGATIGSANNTLRASLNANPGTFTDFTASATAGPPSTVAAKGSNPATAPANSTQSLGVVVRDAGGNLVQGASVTFTITGISGNAAITSTNPALTDASGEASVLVRLDTMARLTTITAVTPGASGNVGTQFNIGSMALAVSKIIITAGNNQTGSPSTVLPVQPQVKTADQYNNFVSGVSVTFAPANGGLVNCTGSNVASCQVVSNGSGIASATWTLGASAGAQTLQASLTSNGTVTTAFTATAAAANPCASFQAIAFGSTVNGSLATSDCLTSGFYGDNYSLTVAASTTQQMAITYQSSAFSPYLLANLWTGGSWINRLTTTGTLTVYYALGPGSYTFNATSNSSGQTGAYSWMATTSPTVPTGCVDYKVTKGITVTHTIDNNCVYDPTNQAGTGQSSVRQYFIYIPANAAVTVRMNAGTLSDPYLECFDATADASAPTVIAGCFDDDAGGGNNSLMVIPTAGTGRYIAIRATHFNNAGGIAPAAGSYTLIIDP